MKSAQGLKKTESASVHKEIAGVVARAMSLEDKLFLVKTKKDRISHIVIDREICRTCESKVCLLVCPAGTYEEADGAVEASYENCLECGSCRISCRQGAISWKNPRGGFGVTYVNG